MVNLPTFGKRTRFNDQQNAAYRELQQEPTLGKIDMHKLSDELGATPQSQSLETYAPKPINATVQKAYEKAAAEMDAMATQLRAAFKQIEEESLHALKLYHEQVEANIRVIEQARDELIEDGSRIFNQINEDASRISSMSSSIKEAINNNKKSVATTPPADGWTTTLE